MSDSYVLAQTIYGESRGETHEGKLGVANVVLNRMALATEHPHFGNGDATSCCLAPWQFSCQNKNDPNCKVINTVLATDPVFMECQQIADDALAGLLTDNTNAATYYKVIGTYALWAEGKTPCATIGHHEFYKDIA